jgi:hypothetical protein
MQLGRQDFWHGALVLGRCLLQLEHGVLANIGRQRYEFGNWASCIGAKTSRAEIAALERVLFMGVGMRDDFIFCIVCLEE